MEKEKKRWREGEVIDINTIKSAALKARLQSLNDDNQALRAYPTYKDIFSQIIVHPKRCDNTGTDEFSALLAELKTYFGEEQKAKIFEKLTEHFDQVFLAENHGRGNSAPFVKEQTFYPAANFFWWVAVHKNEKTPTKRDFERSRRAD